MDENIGAIIWATVGAFELWAARYRPTWTATHVIRRVFRTDSTTVGRVVFLAAWIPIAVWLGWHVLYDV